MDIITIVLVSGFILAILADSYFLLSFIRKNYANVKYWMCLPIVIIYWAIFISMIYFIKIEGFFLAESIVLPLALTTGFLLIAVLFKFFIKVDWRTAWQIALLNFVITVIAILIMLFSGLIWYFTVEQPKSNLTITNCHNKLTEEGFSADDIRANCQYFFSAAGFKNPQYCDSITIKEGQYSRDSCYISSINYLSNDSSWCEKISRDSDSQYSQDNCYKKMAWNQNNASLCLKIKDIYSNNYSRNDCYNSLAQKNKDIQLCDLIENTDQHNFKDSCILKVKLSK